MAAGPAQAPAPNLQETPPAEHARRGDQARHVLLVVPVVEVRLAGRIALHHDVQDRPPHPLPVRPVEQSFTPNGCRGNDGFRTHTA